MGVETAELASFMAFPRQTKNQMRESLWLWNWFAATAEPAQGSSWNWYLYLYRYQCRYQGHVQLCGLSLSHENISIATWQQPELGLRPYIICLHCIELLPCCPPASALHFNWFSVRPHTSSSAIRPQSGSLNPLSPNEISLAPTTDRKFLDWPEQARPLISLARCQLYR